MRAFQLARRQSSNGDSPEGNGVAFGISHEPLGDTAWLFTIEGELDLASADRLREALEGAIRDGANGIVFDLARCSFVDSSGLAVLLEARKTLDGSSPPKTCVALVAPAAQPRRLLQMTSVDTVLPVFETREQAEAAIDGSDGAVSSAR